MSWRVLAQEMGVPLLRKPQRVLAAFTAESRQAPIRLPIRGRREASALAQALKGDNKGKRDRDNL